MNITSRLRAKSFKEGDYLTDQRRLYRVLQLVRPAKFKGRAAILEDCRTLDTLLVPRKELRRMCLEVVRPAQLDAAESHASGALAAVPVLD